MTVNGQNSFAKMNKRATSETFDFNKELEKIWKQVLLCVFNFFLPYSITLMAVKRIERQNLKQEKVLLTFNF